MSLELIITGDFCPIGRNEKFIENLNINEVFGEFLNYISEADLSITNLESPITDSENKIDKSGPNIKLNTNTSKFLHKAGFNLVTLANNHIMDYGKEGLIDTIKKCTENSLETVGAGKNLDEARKIFYFNKNNLTIGIMNIAENEYCTTHGNYHGANPLDLVNNFYDINTAKKNCDQLIIISHGGREHYQLPTPEQKKRYRYFIDCGADIVIGHHTHTFSGYEEYSNKYIFYSLGNFIFDYKEKYQMGKWTEGFALKLNITKDKINFDIIPYYQGRKIDQRLKLLNDNEKLKFQNKLEELNKILKSDSLFIQEWDKYIKSQDIGYKANLFIQNKYIRALISRGFLPKIFFHSKEHKKVLLNLLRCESHREIMIDVLKKDFKF